jgi:hypothetical protein
MIENKTVMSRDIQTLQIAIIPATNPSTHVVSLHGRYSLELVSALISYDGAADGTVVGFSSPQIRLLSAGPNPVFDIVGSTSNKTISVKLVADIAGSLTLEILDAFTNLNFSLFHSCVLTFNAERII